MCSSDRQLLPSMYDNIKYIFNINFEIDGDASQNREVG